MEKRDLEIEVMKEIAARNGERTDAPGTVPVRDWTWTVSEASVCAVAGESINTGLRAQDAIDEHVRPVFKRSLCGNTLSGGLDKRCWLHRFATVQTGANEVFEDDFLQGGCLSMKIMESDNE